MPPDLRIASALLLADVRGVKLLASSREFDTAEAERIAVLFGTPPPGVSCPLAHFACPFGRRQVAVVRVEDRPGGYLGFRFLVLDAELYRHLGDPFAVSDRYPVDWQARGPLPELTWPAEPLPERTVKQLDAILRQGDGPLLLGSTQAIVDGNRVGLRRDQPAEEVVRAVWQLLPDRTRADRWPASFAFADELGFHLMVLPRAVELPDRSFSHPLGEEAVKDYPSSSYELSLQIAIESGDAVALRRLLARRTPQETLRLGLYLLGFALTVAALTRWVF